MEEFAEILNNYYFEIFATTGEQLRCALESADLYRAYAQSNTKPGGYGVFQFENLTPAGEITSHNGAWTCFIKNPLSNRYLNLDWVNFTRFSTNEKRLFKISFTKEDGKAAVWTIGLDGGNAGLFMNQGGGVVGLAFSPENNQKWTFNLRSLHLDYLLDIQYDEPKVPPTTTRHDFIVNSNIKTSPNSTVTSETGLTFSESNTFEWGFETTLAIGATVRSKLSIPGGLAEVEAEVRVDASLTASRKNTITTEIQYSFADQVQIAPNSTAQINAWVDWNNNAQYPFKALVNVRGTALERDDDSDADELTKDAIRLILIEKGFSGEILDSGASDVFRAMIKGTLTGSFGVNKSITITEANTDLVNVAGS